LTRAVRRILAAAVVVAAVTGLGAGSARAAEVNAPVELPCPPVITCNPGAALADEAASHAARAALDAMVGWVADGAKAILDRIAGLVGDPTRIDLTAPWIQGRVGAMRSIAIVLVLPLLLVAFISAVIHQDPGRLVRAVGVHLPVAVLGMFMAVQLTNFGLVITDELCQQISAGIGHQAPQTFQNLSVAMASLSTPLTPGTGGFLAFVTALLVVIGALLIWLELLLRSAAVYVAVMFLPLTLSGLVWPATARCAKRLIEILVALIFSKFVIVAVIDLAVSGLGAQPKDALGAGLAGAAMLLLAGFAPFTLLRLVPVVEAGAIGHLEGMSRRPIAAGVTNGQTVQRVVQSAGVASASAGVATAAGATVAQTSQAVARAATGDAGFVTPMSSSEEPPGGDKSPSGHSAAGVDDAIGVGARSTGPPHNDAEGDHNRQAGAAGGLMTSGTDREGGRGDAE
jgi:type IV secretion system protein TrbL